MKDKAADNETDKQEVKSTLYSPSCGIPISIKYLNIIAQTLGLYRIISRCTCEYKTIYINITIYKKYIYTHKDYM